MEIDYKIYDDGHNIMFESSENPKVSSEEGAVFTMLCVNLQKFMNLKDAKSIKSLIPELHVYLSKFSVVYSPLFSQYLVVPNLLFIVADSENVFDIDTRLCTMEIIYKLLCTEQLLIDNFAQSNAIELFAIHILSNDALFPLHLISLQCLEIFADHCDKCQDLVCQNLPFPFFDTIFQEYPCNIPEMRYLNTGEVNDDQIDISGSDTTAMTDLPTMNKSEEASENTQIAIKEPESKDEQTENIPDSSENPFLIFIFRIICKIFTFPVHPDNMDGCFQYIFAYKTLSSELLKLFFNSFYNIVKYQPRENWYPIFEQCGIRYTIILYLDDPDLLVRQTVLKFIHAVYENKQDFSGLSMNTLLSLIVDHSGENFQPFRNITEQEKEEMENEITEKLEFEIQNRQVEIEYNTSPIDEQTESLDMLLANKLVILYGLEVIYQMIQIDEEFIDRLCKANFFDVCNTLYDGMTSDIKDALCSILIYIAEHGNLNNKKELIEKGLIRLFVDMAVYGTESQSYSAIETMGDLFNLNYKKSCYDSFRKSSSHLEFFQLPNSPNEQVRDIAIKFLDSYFPKYGDQINILVD